MQFSQKIFLLEEDAWVADPKCSFCDNNKSISHLFFECPVAKVIWGSLLLALAQSKQCNSIIAAGEWVEVWIPDGKKCPYIWCVFSSRNLGIWLL
jgi:hypothetical protein